MTIENKQESSDTTPSKRDYQIQYREKNKELLSKKFKEYYEKNKEVINEKRRLKYKLSKENQK